MAKLTDEMKELMSKQLAYISTVSSDGRPNIGPKRTMRIVDDSTLMYNENTGRRTFENLKANGRASVAYVDWEKLDGYRFVGKSEIFTEGKIFDDAVEWAKGKVPKAVVVIHIEEIYTLHIGAPAGTKLQ